MTENGLAVLENRKAQNIALLRELVVNGKKLTDDQIMGRAAFAAIEDLDAISEVQTLVDRDGKTMCHMMGMTGYRRKCQEQAGNGTRIDLEFEELKPEYIKRFPNAVIGFECRLRVGSDYVAWQKSLVEVGRAFKEAGVTVTFAEIMQVVGPAPVHTGIGIVYSSELNEYKDRNFSPVERAKKRAEKNARSKRFPTHAPVYDGNSNGDPVVSDEVIDTTFTESPSTPANVGYSREQALSDLGYAPEPEQPSILNTAAELGGVAVEQPTAKMSLEAAESVTTKDGTTYGEIDSDELNEMLAKMTVKLNANAFRKDVIDDVKYNCDAIRVILASRQ